VSERFQIRIDPWWQPLLLVGGGTREGSYVEIDEGKVKVRFGWFFDREIALGDIEGVQEMSWPLWYGVGWRTNFSDLVGLIGSHQGVVELALRTPLQVWGLLRYKRLAVSLEEPQRFIEAMARAALQAVADGARERPADAFARE
jgi:hypothetical protein